jgi:hypothetical protein
MYFFREGSVKRLTLLAVGVAALVAAAAAFAATSTTASTRLVSITSPARRNSYATLVARVVPAHRCSIAVYYKSGPSHAQGLYPKGPAPGGGGRISWTWKVGGNTTLGRWPIKVNCGSAGAFTTHFRVIR